MANIRQCERITLTIGRRQTRLAIWVVIVRGVVAELQRATIALQEGDGPTTDRVLEHRAWMIRIQRRHQRIQLGLQRAGHERILRIPVHFTGIECRTVKRKVELRLICIDRHLHLGRFIHIALCRLRIELGRNALVRVAYVEVLSEHPTTLRRSSPAKADRTSLVVTDDNLRGISIPCHAHACQHFLDRGRDRTANNRIRRCCLDLRLDRCCQGRSSSQRTSSREVQGQQSAGANTIDRDGERRGTATGEVHATRTQGTRIDLNAIFRIVGILASQCLRRGRLVHRCHHHITRTRREILDSQRTTRIVTNLDRIARHCDIKFARIKGAIARRSQRCHSRSQLSFHHRGDGVFTVSQVLRHVHAERAVGITLAVRQLEGVHRRRRIGRCTDQIRDTQGNFSRLDIAIEGHRTHRRRHRSGTLAQPLWLEQTIDLAVISHVKQHTRGVR